MSQTFQLILELVARQEVKISDHGYDELAEDGILVREIMISRGHTKFVREGSYAAEVDVQLIESEAGWAPYLSLEDAQKLDDVRDALRRGDLKKAGQLARVFKLELMAV